jgi:predicted anti-sigma-YlaC factor YlaD
MMHRIIRDHLEQVLAGSGSAPEHPAGQHLAVCEECREAVAVMREQAAMLRQWRAADVEAIEPRAGFYARVLERIESQTPISVFTLFFDSLFARRIAMASFALALLLGVYVVSSEQTAEQQESVATQATLVSNQVSDQLSDQVYEMPQNFSGAFSTNSESRLVTGTPNQDAVLVNLVTYREQ